jgi:hypothetical protein
MRNRCLGLVLAVIVGCVDELASVEAPDQGVTGREQELRSDAKVASEPAACDFEAERTKRLGGHAPERDCGNLEPNAAQAQAEAAERCVLDAIAAGETFTLLHAQESLRTAYVGGPLLVAIMNEVEHGDAGLPRAFSTSCRRLVQAEHCTPSADALCLVCQDEVEHATECEQQRDEPCSPPGNYSRGTLDTVPGCCPGLHKVEQRARVFSDDSSSTCAYSPVRLFSCIEGFCGDGLCEPEEAVACGCALDCPIASD